MSWTDIIYSIQMDIALDELIKEITLRKNIVLIIKEAVNNVAKYSKASRLYVKSKIINNTIIIEIIDNGIGFDSQLILGNGIQNMKKRVQELNGDIEIKSILNIGTSIRVTIPFIP
jgi:signal transduction histidine kinase